jgi:hypothetical protein
LTSKKWVKNIQTAGYNGARTVYKKGNPEPFGILIKSMLLKREYKQTLSFKIKIKDLKIKTGSNLCLLTVQMAVPFNKLPWSLGFR